MLFINSIRKTVLPTPAPPNNPILPPLGKGANKSTTLMPVSRISDTGSTLYSSGNWGRMEVGSDLSIGPFPSMGCPNTSSTLPKTESLTEICIGLPVSTTRSPLDSPSVEPKAMHFAVFFRLISATSRGRMGVFSSSSTCNKLLTSGIIS